jgi:hypothetical protein
MQGSEMTNSWLRLKRVIVGFIRIKITVGNIIADVDAKWMS